MSNKTLVSTFKGGKVEILREYDHVYILVTTGDPSQALVTRFDVEDVQVEACAHAMLEAVRQIRHVPTPIDDRFKHIDEAIARLQHLVVKDLWTRISDNTYHRYNASGIGPIFVVRRAIGGWCWFRKDMALDKEIGDRIGPFETWVDAAIDCDLTSH